MKVILFKISSPQYIHLDIDAQLNKLIPPSPLPLLPTWISHFLGYRHKQPVPDVGSILIAFWALIGTFIALLTVAATMKYVPWIAIRMPPVLIASLGAAAVLDFNTILSPLAMPRNSIFGHTLAAFIGVCFAQLMLLSAASPDDLSWVLAPLACGTASAVMTLTNSIYPPGGATALLAVADPQVRRLGWWLVLLVFVASLIMLSVALVVNNCQRQYPLWWWSPLKTGQLYRRRRKGGAHDVEQLSKGKRLQSDESVTHIEDAATVADGSAFDDSIVLSANGMLNVPDWLQLDDAERIALDGILEKLQSPDYGRSVIEKTWTGDREPS